MMIRNSGPLAGQDLLIPVPTSAKEHEYNKALNEIDITSLIAGDQLLIETNHSIYIFIIADPRKGIGNLIGGLLGNYMARACLLSLSIDKSTALQNRKSLRPSMHARFLIESGNRIRCLCTSPITKLIHRSARDTQARF